jgi:hypothetical protein
VKRPRVIVQIRGGLGNQLFCYAAARRLAHVNDAELVLDDMTGFALDKVYRRSYLLHHFNVAGRRASAAERSEPFGRLRRGLKRFVARRRPFEERSYIEQQGVDFDARLLDVRLRGTVYLEGYWQGEGYFSDVEELIHRDFELKQAPNLRSSQLAKEMQACNSVALHVRWFDRSRAEFQPYNVPADYYRRALAVVGSRILEPRLFVFSDDLSAARDLGLPAEMQPHYVDVNQGSSEAQLDFWLMSQCRHFVIANSTFSWWAAWLGQFADKLVVAPACELIGTTAWGFRGLLPDAWAKIDCSPQL